MENDRLTSTERQLLLYDIFRRCQQISYEEITTRLPLGRKMVQRYSLRKKLKRMATLMEELVTDSESYYEDDGDDYFSCKKCYYELFPDANEKMRQRDFAQLNKIGYHISYDNTERRYNMWSYAALREDFGVYKENGKLMRCKDSQYDVL